MMPSNHTKNLLEDLGRRDFLQAGVLMYTRAIVMTGVPLCFDGRSSKEKRMEKLYTYLIEQNGEESASVINERIKGHYELLNGRKPHFTKWGMNFNITNAIIALSAYRALLEHTVSEEEAINITETLVWETLPVNIYKNVFRFISETPDPLSSYVFMTKQLNRIVFPSPGWERNYVVENNCFGFNVTKCLYVDYLKSEGAPELVVALCNLDYRVAELLSEDISFHRNMSIARGDEVCDFRYCRR